MNKKLLPMLMPIRSAVFFLIFVICSLIVGSDLQGVSNWWSVTATIVNIVTVFVLMKLAKKNGQTYWKLINYEKGKTKIKEVVIVTIVILSLGMGGMCLSGLICYGVFPYLAPMMIAPIPAVLAIINVPLLPVTTALAEEGIYLGCGVNQIKNKYAAILIPAFFFALQHSFIPTLFDVRYMFYRFLSFLPLTIALCRYYYKHRDPLPIMIGHAVIDVATVMQILATSTIDGFYDTMCSA